MKYRLKHIVEYAFLRLVVGIVRRLPYNLALFVGWTIAWPAHYVFRFRARQAKNRIAKSLATASLSARSAVSPGCPGATSFSRP